ncbi:hypothetical protein RS022_06290 [Candidatus Phytoplasma rubi]|uniref:Uncharacterized protein n=1 Tax=Candidatus Phytoplasma rubi TaxID=399025 RepID=A0ABY7BTW7_9MOLU|nr:hypothetical protein [Candidatus Phytoplasma rubi]WAN63472.1 hypothetical protein RS022_06290 [Candidatus Phytoplasma rubi]
MGKVTLLLHESHHLWHIYNEVANENKESSPMITKETLEMYFKDIDRDLAKLDTDYKDYKKKKEEYNNKFKSDEAFHEFEESSELVRKIKRKEESVINEYEKIVFEINEKRKQIAYILELEKNHNELEEELYDKNEEINVKKE